MAAILPWDIFDTQLEPATAPAEVAPKCWTCGAPIPAHEDEFCSHECWYAGVGFEQDRDE